MKISYSKHAINKMNERKINKEWIEKILQAPEMAFYDFVNKTFIAISRIKIMASETHLVLIYTKDEDAVKIVTVYPCKNIEKEIRNKEGNRWIRI